ncbi:Probable polyamine oxidase 4 [Seminavis robusta]|uniref:Probable polyamine oxidase 4 n=1 Tax=Seminavis robusta TaxID=568900 RepID=A0A9N8HK87_9STRA|nr:Probable polyamine oxidase 4 [Seminavis robusta]|eukprot:Sro738_g195300.1 Probable polyamine oxidase 4 (477) ;mRNA; r:23919-25349
MPEQQTGVVVIGAGWAGLAAAKELCDQNVDCCILEGRNRIGGRCWTDTGADGVTPLEWGAAWIHGIKKNPIYDIAKASGVKTKEADYEARTLWKDQPDGSCSQMSLKEADKMWGYLMNGKSGFKKYVEHKQDDVDNDWTLQKTVDAFLNKINATDEQRRFMRYICDAEFEQDMAASLDEISMFWFDSDGEFKGGDVTLANATDSGYSAVLKHYAKDILHCVHCQSKVTAIDYEHDDGVVVTYTTADGASHKIVASAVIVTVPLGVLKANVITFNPPLPSNKQLVIDRMGMGVLNKCMLLFDDDAELPWPADKEWIERIVTGEDPEKPQGLWTEIVCLRPEGGKRILCANTVGHIARKLEAKSNQEIQDSVMSELKTIFAPQDVPEPCQCVITKWGQDEFAYGSFSFNAIGAKHLYHRILNDPVDNKVFFAGEACSEKYFATTHGAYLTGIDAAKNAAKHCGSDKKGPAKLLQKIFG